MESNRNFGGKTIVIEMKQSLEGFDRQLEQPENKISKLLD